MGYAYALNSDILLPQEDGLFHFANMMDAIDYLKGKIIIENILNDCTAHSIQLMPKSLTKIIYHILIDAFNECYISRRYKIRKEVLFIFQCADITAIMPYVVLIVARVGYGIFLLRYIPRRIPIITPKLGQPIFIHFTLKLDYTF